MTDDRPGGAPDQHASALLGAPSPAPVPVALLERLEQELPAQTGPVPVQGPRPTAPVTDPRLFDAPLPARAADSAPLVPGHVGPDRPTAPNPTATTQDLRLPAEVRRQVPAPTQAPRSAAPGRDRAATASIRSIQTPAAIAPELSPRAVATQPKAAPAPVLLAPAAATRRSIVPHERSISPSSAPFSAPIPAFRRRRSVSLAACAVAVLGTFSTVGLLIPDTTSAEADAFTSTIDPSSTTADEETAGSTRTASLAPYTKSGADAAALWKDDEWRRTHPGADPTTTPSTSTARHRAADDAASPTSDSADGVVSGAVQSADAFTADDVTAARPGGRRRAAADASTAASTDAPSTGDSTTSGASDGPSGTPTPDPSPTGTTPDTGDFVSGVTKPSASNTGAGVLRPYPTRVIEGNVTLTGNQSLKDVIVHGRVSVKGTGNVIENAVITGAEDASYSGSVWLVNTSAAKDAVVRFSTIRSSTTSAQVNGIGLRNVTAERNDVSRVIDGFDIDPGPGGGDVNTTIKDNWVHDLMFVGPGSGHAATPTPSSYSGPWARTSWSHDDAIQITGGNGLRIVGNAFDARWADDIGTTPLPTIVKELSVLMLNAHNGPVTGLVMKDNWIDGGEYAINGGGGAGSGVFTGNRFGSHIAGPANAPWTLMFGSGFRATTSDNTYEVGGGPVRVRTGA